MNRLAFLLVKKSLLSGSLEKRRTRILLPIFGTGDEASLSVSAKVNIHHQVNTLSGCIVYQVEISNDGESRGPRRQIFSPPSDPKKCCKAVHEEDAASRDTELQELIHRQVCQNERGDDSSVVGIFQEFQNFAQKCTDWIMDSHDTRL